MQEEFFEQGQVWYYSKQSDGFKQERLDQNLTFCIMQKHAYKRDRFEITDEFCQASRKPKHMTEACVQLNIDECGRDGISPCEKFATMMIPNQVILKHLQAFKTIFKVDIDCNTIRLENRSDCKLSKFRFIVKGFWKLCWFQGSPQYVLDPQSFLAILPANSVGSVYFAEGMFTFSATPTTYRIPASHFKLYTEHETGSPFFGNVVEVTPNFAFCEVLMAFGTVHLVSADPQKLRKLLEFGMSSGRPGRTLIMRNLQYWSREIPGVDMSFLASFRSRTQIYQALEITKCTDFLLGPLTDSRKMGSLHNYPDELLEKISRNQSIKERIRSHASKFPVQLPEAIKFRERGGRNQRGGKGKSHKPVEPAQTEFAVKKAEILLYYQRVNPRAQDERAKSDLLPKQSDESKNKQREYLNPPNQRKRKPLELEVQTVPTGSSESSSSECEDSDTDSETGTEGAVPASRGKPHHTEQQAPVWEESLSPQSPQRLPEPTAFKNKLSFFSDYETDEEEEDDRPENDPVPAKAQPHSQTKIAPLSVAKVPQLTAQAVQEPVETVKRQSVQGIRQQPRPEPQVAQQPVETIKQTPILSPEPQLVPSVRQEPVPTVKQEPVLSIRQQPQPEVTLPDNQERVKVVLQKFKFLQGRTPAEWYNQTKSRPN